MANVQYYGTGRRKHSVARVRLVAGEGNIIVNGQYKEIKIEKGIIRLTQFGFDFTKACIIENEIIFDK